MVNAKMMKKYLTILMSLILISAPTAVYAQSELDGVEVSLSGISVTASGSSVRVSGANGETLEIFNITGVKVATVRIDSDDKTFTLNLPKGCYLLKIDKVVRKISIK